jgi:hypothetical protein
MKLTNEAQPLVVGQTLAFRQDGRELLVVVAKGTFVLVEERPEGGGPRLADEQVALLTSDVFGVDPAKNAPLLENDFAPTKPECDVLVNGSAYAPHERPRETLDVGVGVGPMRKSFRVTGPRTWSSAVVGSVSAGTPQKFSRQPISYDVAFGGTEVDPDDPRTVATYVENPAGRGFRRHKLDLRGQAMPVTEEIAHPIHDPRKPYRPMALGPLGRNWKPRLDYVGTYDQKWMDEVAPMLPQDFSPLHFQAAPPDQRLPYPRGGEPIELQHIVPAALSPSTCARTTIPHLKVTMLFVPGRGAPVRIRANLDTIAIEPDANRFTCSWRAAYPALRDMFEIAEVIILNEDSSANGRVRARLSGKPYFHGLAELIGGRKGRAS